MIKSKHHWGKLDNVKLHELVNQGKIDLKDINLSAIKAIDKHWKHKPFKSFKQLLCKEFKKIASGQLLDGA
jgi:hypothetical protein